MDGASGLLACLEQHRGELARFLAARCGDAGEAEDLLQDLWLKVAGLTPGPVTNPRAYLFRMANNLVLDRARARRRDMARDRAWIDADGPSPETIEDRPDPALPADEALAREQEAALVRAAIDRLPPGAARAFRLCRIEGRKLEETAGILGISRSGVEKHLALAMKNLRADLIDCGFFAAAASSSHKAAVRRDGASAEHER